MTEQEIAVLGPAFVSYVARFRPCFVHKTTVAHFGTYCRGLLSELPRKSRVDHPGGRWGPLRKRFSA